MKGVPAIPGSLKVPSSPATERSPRSSHTNSFWVLRVTRPAGAMEALSTRLARRRPFFPRIRPALSSSWGPAWGSRLNSVE
jgi:hypothetical protein